LSDEEAATAAALKAEYEGYEETYAEVSVYPEAIDLRLGEIETALEALKARPMVYDPADLAIAGAFLSLDSSGRLRIERGYVLPEDEPPVLTAEGEAEIEDADGGDDNGVESSAEPVAGQPAEEEIDEPGRPLPDRLVSEMTVHRTIALRDALAGHPDLAFLAVLHALCLSLFSRGAFDTCLEIEAKSLAYAQQPTGLAETPCAAAISTRHKAWAEQLPRDPDRMWEALVAFDHDSRQALFAHCVGLTINALYEGWNRRPRALAHADRLAQAMQLDMVAAGWAPTVEAFFSRITKGQMLDTVREAQGDGAADRIAGLKKDDMAVEAARLVEGTGWLPRPLRTLPLTVGSASEADGDASIAGVVQSAEIGGETAMEPQGQIADDADGQVIEPHAVAAE
ncbi:MAG: DNA-binding protein, partial [Phenylobacterium zucineum]